MSNTTKYNWEQTVLSLAFLSYCISIPKNYLGSEEYLTELATEAIRETLNDSDVQQLIGKWELVWGAAIYQVEGMFDTSSMVNDNTMFVVKQVGNPQTNPTADPPPDKYVISIAGTNPSSIYDWLVEDFAIVKMRAWNRGKPWKNNEEDPDNQERAVSFGTSTGLKHLMKDMSHKDKFLIDYLKELTSNATNPIEITVTGHSLGGALSSSLALALVDRQAEWDDQKIAKVKVLSAAGPSAGNEAFAEHYDRTFGSDAKRIWNKLDIVPNGWENEAVGKIPGMYEPSLQSNFFMEYIFGGLQLLTKDNKYQRICKEIAGFDSDYNDDVNYEPGRPDKTAQMISKALDGSANLIAQAWLMQIREINNPLIPDVWEEALKKKYTRFIHKFAKQLRNNIELIITNSVSLSQLLLESLEKSFDNIGVGFAWEMASWGEEIISYYPEKLRKNSEIVLLVNYLLQMGYQHVTRYVEEYKIEEFDDKRAEITERVSVRMEKQKEMEEPTPATIVVNYGTAQKDDISDLYNGEGKLLAGVTGTLEKLKESGNVKQNAQPVVFIVKKKNDTIL